MLIMDCNRCISRLSISLSPFAFEIPLHPIKYSTHGHRECQRAKLCWKLAYSSFSNTLIKEALSISQPVCPGYAAGPASQPRLSWPCSLTIASPIRKTMCFPWFLLSANHCANARSSCWNSIAIKSQRKASQLTWLVSNFKCFNRNCQLQKQLQPQSMSKLALSKSYSQKCSAVFLLFAVFSWLYKLNCSFNLEWK